MSINFEKAFGIHPQALQLRARRGEVLASNIANADTPGYKAKDLDFSSVLKAAQLDEPVALKTSNAKHVAEPALSLGAQLLYRIPAQASLDGNTVEVHVEQAKHTENALQYQASLRFINGRIAGLMSALKGE